MFWGERSPDVGGNLFGASEIKRAASCIEIQELGVELNICGFGLDVGGPGGLCGKLEARIEVCGRCGECTNRRKGQKR